MPPGPLPRPRNPTFRGFQAPITPRGGISAGRGVATARVPDFSRTRGRLRSGFGGPPGPYGRPVVPLLPLAVPRDPALLGEGQLLTPGALGAVLARPRHHPRPVAGEADERD